MVDIDAVAGKEFVLRKDDRPIGDGTHRRALHNRVVGAHVRLPGRRVVKNPFGAEIAALRQRFGRRGERQRKARRSFFPRKYMRGFCFLTDGALHFRL